MQTDDMNDYVLMGLARDAAEAEVERLNAVLSKLGELARLRSLPLMQAVLSEHFETNNK